MSLWSRTCFFVSFSRARTCLFEHHTSLNETSTNPRALGIQVQCWICNDEAHSPCRCNEVKDWAQLSNEDKVLENLKKQCKMCPKCGMGAYISDKNACNHMTCPCGHHWCWMCLKDWSTHGSSYYACKFYSKDKKAQKMNQERDQELADIKRLQEFEERIAPLISASSGPASKSLFKTKTDLQKHLEIYCGLTQKQVEFLDDAAMTVTQMKRMLKYCNIYLYFRPNSAEDSDRKLFESQMINMTFLCDTLHVLLDPDSKNNEHQYGLLRRILGLPSTEESSQRTKKRAKMIKTSSSSRKEDNSQKKFHVSYDDIDSSDPEERRVLFHRYSRTKKYTK